MKPDSLLLQGRDYIKESSDFLETEYEKIKDDALIRSVLSLALMTSELPIESQVTHGRELLTLLYVVYMLGRYSVSFEGEK